MSALQLSRQRPEQTARYKGLAEHHSTKALQTATALLKDLEVDNCPALYISATLICFVYFAKGPSPGNLLLVAFDAQVPWLSLIRGVKLVVSRLGWSSIFSGTLAKYHPRESSDHWKRQSNTPKTVASFIATPTEDWRISLQKVSYLIDFLPNQHCRETYSQELEMLEGCLEVTFGKGKDADVTTTGRMEVIMSWVYGVRDDFVDRLGRKDPPAFIILAHFCVLLRTLEYYWFIQGWALHIITEIVQENNSTHLELLAWPLKYLRMDK